ncbi:hypothetical protein [Streptomyces decoyicus]|uniref:hypothetical protein n=1 Tax=Streptomyces decoyicus TaxID=249567 RepID=UPI0033AAFDF0
MKAIGLTQFGGPEVLPTFPEAVTLLLNAVTARLSLNTLALSPGTTLVVAGAAGEVGGFAVETAKADGLTVLAYTSDADQTTVRDLGADQVVLRRQDATSDIRGVLPGGAPALIDGAALNAQVLGAVVDGGAMVSLKGWTGPTERGITIHPVSSYRAAPGRFTGHGQPAPWIAVDILRVEDGILMEHWDVIEEEASREQSVSGLPMYGDTFPEER